MDWLKDGLSGNVVAVAVAGATGLMLPMLVPSLGPPLRAALKLGTSLFLESESELSEKMIQELVQDTLQGILGALAQPGTAAEHRERVAVHIDDFQAKARRRASRFGWDEQDRAARYRQQVASLKGAISHAKRTHTKAARPVLEHASEMISEDW